MAPSCRGVEHAFQTSGLRPSGAIRNPFFYEDSSATRLEFPNMRTLLSTKIAPLCAWCLRTCDCVSTDENILHRTYIQNQRRSLFFFVAKLKHAFRTSGLRPSGSFKHPFFYEDSSATRLVSPDMQLLFLQMENYPSSDLYPESGA